MQLDNRFLEFFLLFRTKYLKATNMNTCDHIKTFSLWQHLHISFVIFIINLVKEFFCLNFEEKEILNASIMMDVLTVFF